MASMLQKNTCESTNKANTTKRASRPRRLFRGFTGCVLGALSMGCASEVGSEEELTDRAVWQGALTADQKARNEKEESLLNQILPPELEELFGLAKDIHSVYKDVTGVIDAVKFVGSLLGISERGVDERMLEQLEAIRFDIAALHGTVLGVAHTETLRDILDITTEGVTAGAQAQDFVISNNRPLSEKAAQTVLLASGTAVNIFTTDALSPDPAYFQRPFHGRNGVDDQNLGNTQGEWKEVITAPDIRTGSTGTASNKVWDWRLGLPALMQTITARTMVLSSVYPDFITSNRFDEDLLRYRRALTTVRDKMVSNVRCNFSLYQPALDTSLAEFQFELRALCVDPFTGAATVVSRTASVPAVRVNCARRWEPPTSAPRYCFGTSRGRSINNFGPDKDFVMTEIRRLADFKDVLDNGLADSRALLLNRLGIFELQGLIDELFRMANNSSGPLNSNGFLEQRDVPNRCVQAAPNDREGKLIVSECQRFGSVVVQTPVGPQTVQTQHPIAQPWRYVARKGQLIAPDGRCMDVRGGSSRTGTRVWLWSCNESDAQRWSFDYEKRVLRNKLGTVLDVQWNNTAVGTPVWTWSENGGRAQLFGPRP